MNTPIEIIGGTRVLYAFRQLSPWPRRSGAFGLDDILDLTGALKGKGTRNQHVLILLAAYSVSLVVTYFISAQVWVAARFILAEDFGSRMILYHQTPVASHQSPEPTAVGEAVLPLSRFTSRVGGGSASSLGVIHVSYETFHTFDCCGILLASLFAVLKSLVSSPSPPFRFRAPKSWQYCNDIATGSGWQIEDVEAQHRA